jgi:hypothetical protein
MMSVGGQNQQERTLKLTTLTLLKPDDLGVHLCGGAGSYLLLTASPLTDHIRRRH